MAGFDPRSQSAPSLEPADSTAGAGEGDPLAEILFERTGPIDGPILVKPITRPRTWEDLESLVGEPITDRD